MKIDPQIKHDFINNSLRLEVLMKIICDNLDKKIIPEKQFLDDFEKFLEVEKNLFKEIKDLIHCN